MTKRLYSTDYIEMQVKSGAGRQKEGLGVFRSLGLEEGSFWKHEGLLRHTLDQEGG